ncbi:MAG: GH3 auxin-responsive promoter family protein [Oscillospiraceae bacterium]|nr:GH3 auxin-responsive promoter family protein [Oscillospiraceae bacterium]
MFDKLLNRVVLQIMISRGSKTLKTLEANVKRGKSLNEETLFRVLSDSRDTVYGRKYGFENIKTVEDFKRAVPLSSFEDYADDIDRMKNDGEEGLLTNNPIVFYAMSSGSCGRPKDFPVTQEEIDCYATFAATRLFACTENYHKQKYGRGFPRGKGLNTMVVKSTLTKQGIRKGWISCAAVESQKQFLKYVLTSPDEVLFPTEECDMKYLQIRYALMDRDMVFMVGNFMVYLVELINYAKSNWEMLCRDIELGVIDPSVELGPNTRRALEEKLRPDPQRAAELRALGDAGFVNPIIPKIWPRMSWIGAVGSNNFSPYTTKMRALAGDGVFIDFMQYGASESLLGCTRASEEQAFVLIPDSCYYEFIPIDAPEDSTDTLDVSQLEVGREYEIIITNKAGLYRYRVGDVVRVMGYYHEMPMVQCAYRKSEMIRLTCEKTTEAMVNSMIESFCRETGISLSNFSIYGDTNATPPRYVLLLEPEKSVDLSKTPQYEQFLEEKLEYLNMIYADYIKSRTLAPLKLYFSKIGSHREYNRIRLQGGGLEHQTKPVRVLDTQDKRDFFLARVETA